MFDLGWQELFIIAAIGLIVVGPKDLPRVLSQITKYVRKARGIAREFQSNIDEVVRQADLEEIRKDVEKNAGLDLENDIRNTLDPGGEIARRLDVSDIQADIERSARSVTEGTASTPAETTPPPAAESEPAAAPDQPHPTDPANPGTR